MKDFKMEDDPDSVEDDGLPTPVEWVRAAFKDMSKKEVLETVFPYGPESFEEKTETKTLKYKQSQSSDNRAKSQNTIYTSSIHLPDGTMLEEIYDEHNGQEPFQFVIRMGETGQISYAEDFRFEGSLYKPIQSEIVTKKALSLPSKAEDYMSEGMLLQKIQDHIHRYVELNQSFERIVAYYVLLTYCYDSFSELPFLRVKADRGTGKSRFLLTVGPMCYKALIAGGAITASPIFRFIDEWGGTLIIDEADFKSSEMYDEIIKILNCRFNRGMPVLRSEPQGRKWETAAYDVYGPTILATRGDFKDKALESRCITYNMQPRTRDDIPLNINEEELSRGALHLRNMLLQWRLDKVGKIRLMPDRQIEGIEDRLNQIIIPLLSIVEDEKVRNDLTGFMKSYNHELIEDRGLTEEFQVLHTIAEIIKEKKPNFDDTKVHKHDLFSFKAITEQINRDRDERDRITPQKVGYILKNLDLKKDRYKNSGYLDYCQECEPKLKALSKRYGIECN